eukprot:4567901-Amphidinium_carterae.1
MNNASGDVEGDGKSVAMHASVVSYGVLLAQWLGHTQQPRMVINLAAPASSILPGHLPNSSHHSKSHPLLNHRSLKRCYRVALPRQCSPS